MPRRLAFVVLIAALVVGFIVVRQLPELWETDPIDIPANETPDQQPTASGPPVGDLEAIECSLDVERWDSGSRADVERKYGENAEAVVEGCRAIVAPPAP